MTFDKPQPRSGATFELSRCIGQCEVVLLLLDCAGDYLDSLVLTLNGSEDIALLFNPAKCWGGFLLGPVCQAVL